MTALESGPDVDSVREPVAATSPGLTVGDLVDALFVPVVLAGLVTYFTLRSDTFLTTRNLEQILISSSGLAIAAAGTTFVIIARELDLSIGANAALAGVIATTAMTEWTSSVPFGVVAGMLTGLVIGAVNGTITTAFKVPSFVTTLGVSFVLGGIALAITGGSSVSGVPRSFGNLANTLWLDTRTIVWSALIVFVIGYLALHRMAFGLRVFAVGTNAQAARLAGLRVDVTRLITFVIGGFCAGLAGVLLASRLRSGSPGANGELALTAIAAVVLGGTSIGGGRGSMLRTVAGVVLIGVLKNGLDNLGVDFAYQNIWIGIVFILAACSQIIRSRFRSATTQGAVS
jgi:ribose/xylose/arabinose/galactoside ABC-type transport system permease subunit